MLRRHAFFLGLEPGQTTLLEPLFKPVSYAPGNAIFTQGEDAIHLYLLIEGTIEIRYKPYDGAQITVTHLQAGDVFGWSSVVGTPFYTSSIYATSKVETLRVLGSDLRKLAKDHPATGEVILEKLAQIVSSRWKNARAQAKTLTDPITSEPSVEAKAQINSLIERLSAYVEQFHGGSVTVVSFDGKTLKVKLGGACLDCPLQPATLHGWVAGTVHQFFPDVEVVEEK